MGPADTASVERSGAGGGTEARYPQTGGFATNESARQAVKADTHRKVGRMMGIATLNPSYGR